MELLEYLYSNINKSKNTIKNLLKNGNIYVNGKVITKYNYLVKDSDKVDIRNKVNDIDIIYEDKNIIIVNKPYNMLTISTEKEREKTLYHIVSDYVKRGNKSNKIFIVHRLDKDTSGLVMFSKNEKTKSLLQNNWDKVNREYIAIVEGKINSNGVIKTKLDEKNGRVFSSNSGKVAITKYNRLKFNDKYSLLNIKIETGRKHQIRVHLSELGYPIVGDKKYGNTNPIKRMTLHAYKLEFILYGRNYSFEVDIPNSFKKLIK